jgi:hypothetical protein
MTHGEPAKGVELSSPLAATLGWLLDQLHIPHDFTNEAMCIPFSLLERQMRQANDAYSNVNPITPSESDHEKQAAMKTLMEEWKRKQEGGK